jgi:hypothetical protein
MLKAVLWSIMALLHSALAPLFFVKGDVSTGLLNLGIAIICAALSLITAREE